jgi:hypothetical protein
MEQDEINKLVELYMNNPNARVRIGLKYPNSANVTGFIVGKGKVTIREILEPVDTVLIKVVMRTVNINIDKDPFETELININSVNLVDLNGSFI